MPDARVILDFPGPPRNHERIAPGRPRAVLEAHRLEEVQPVLREAERAAAGGAWVAGFVAYEAAPAFDRALYTRPHEGPAPLAWFGVFEEMDEAVDAGPDEAVGPGPDEAVGPGPDEVVGPGPDEVVDAGLAAGHRIAALPPLSWVPDVTRAGYDAAIRSIRDSIASGDVYQVNHTVRFRAACELAPRDVHDALTRARHGRYHALIETADWAIVSASPELFIDVRDGVITARPMKGTARRGRWSDEDDAAAAALARSEKDRAENLMIVDLLRNDLGRVARFGSVAVRDMFAVETYPTVHQLTSTVSAQLRDDVSLCDIFSATFPCGSVTGAPKVAAMQRIAELEPTPRGAYCGAIGVIRPDGSATFSVGIRTLVIDRAKNTAVYGAGGGITWDSAADAEYDELLAKAALLADADGAGFDLLETMRIEDGRVQRRDLHLARLTASARYWGFPVDVRSRADEALRRLEEGAPEGTWRVRMTVSRDAHVSIALVRMDAGAGSGAAVGASPAAVGDAGSDARSGALPAAVADPRQASGGAGDAPLIRLADTPVDSRNPLLHHKTTARDVYDRRRAQHPDAFDVLLHNERRCITEFTIGNVVCEIDGELLTPPRDAGLLGGTFREALLRAGIVSEADIPVADIGRVSRMWLINSVREWVEVRW